jgi:hypothetical protein
VSSINRNAQISEWIEVKGEGNVFELVDQLCKQFELDKISSCMGELGLSVEDLARNGKTLSSDCTSTLIRRLEKAEQFKWEDSLLERIFQAWCEQIKKRKIPKNRSMLSYFEREAYHASSRQLNNLPDFLKEIRNVYGNIEALMVVHVLKPSVANRLRFGYHISADEIDKLKQVAYKLFQTFDPKSMKLTKKHFSKTTLDWTCSATVTAFYEYEHNRPLRDRMRAEWLDRMEAECRDRMWAECRDSESDSDCYPIPAEPTLYINGYTQEEWENEQDRKESIIDSRQESRDDGCTIS